MDCTAVSHNNDRTPRIAALPTTLHFSLHHFNIVQLAAIALSPHSERFTNAAMIGASLSWLDLLPAKIHITVQLYAQHAIFRGAP